MTRSGSTYVPAALPEPDLQLLAATMQRPPAGWRRRARCRGANPDMFSPSRGQAISEAREVCASCPVRMPCLAEAMLRNWETDVWGGLSVRDRRNVRRQLVDRFGQAWLTAVRRGQPAGVVDDLLDDVG